LQCKAYSDNAGDDKNAVKNSDRKSFNYKIFTKIEFGCDDVINPKTIRYSFMGLSDAIVKFTKRDSESIYLANRGEIK
jgi:hypothetical protein